MLRVRSITTGRCWLPDSAKHVCVVCVCVGVCVCVSSLPFGPSAPLLAMNSLWSGTFFSAFFISPGQVCVRVCKCVSEKICVCSHHKKACDETCWLNLTDNQITKCPTAPWQTDQPNGYVFQQKTQDME